MSVFLYSQLRSFRFVNLIAHRQQKTLLTRSKQGLEILWTSITCLPPVYPIWVLDPDTPWIGSGRTHNSTGYDVSLTRLASSAKSLLICSCKFSSNAGDVYTTKKVTSNIFPKILQFNEVNRRTVRGACGA